MKADYAKRKLTSLLADDLRCYTDGEFARQMMRIVDGATGFDVEKMIEQNALLAQRVAALQSSALGSRYALLCREINAMAAELIEYTEIPTVTVKQLLLNALAMYGDADTAPQAAKGGE